MVSGTCSGAFDGGPGRVVCVRSAMQSICAPCGRRPVRRGDDLCSSLRPSGRPFSPASIILVAPRPARPVVVAVPPARAVVLAVALVAPRPVVVLGPPPRPVFIIVVARTAARPLFMLVVARAPRPARPAVTGYAAGLLVLVVVVHVAPLARRLGPDGQRQRHGADAEEPADQVADARGAEVRPPGARAGDDQRDQRAEARPEQPPCDEKDAPEERAVALVLRHLRDLIGAEYEDQDLEHGPLPSSLQRRPPAGLALLDARPCRRQHLRRAAPPLRV